MGAGVSAIGRNISDPGQLYVLQRVACKGACPDRVRGGCACGGLIQSPAIAR